jgi:hypothetical protein
MQNPNGFAAGVQDGDLFNPKAIVTSFDERAPGEGPYSEGPQSKK